MAEKLIKWKKIGGGTFRMKDGRIIKPNQVFEAYESDIPEVFRRWVIPLDPFPKEKVKVENNFEIKPAESKNVKEKDENTEKELDIKEDEELEVEMVHRGGGWYDVVNKKSGKKINEKPLKKTDAEILLETLTE